MDLKIKTTAHLTQSDVKTLLMKAMERQMPGYRATAVSFNVSQTGDERYGQSYSLTGIDVTMEPSGSFGLHSEDHA